MMVKIVQLLVVLTLALAVFHRSRREAEYVCFHSGLPSPCEFLAFLAVFAGRKIMENGGSLGDLSPRWHSLPVPSVEITYECEDLSGSAPLTFGGCFGGEQSMGLKKHHTSKPPSPITP